MGAVTNHRHLPWIKPGLFGKGQAHARPRLAAKPAIAADNRIKSVSNAEGVDMLTGGFFGIIRGHAELVALLQGVQQRGERHQRIDSRLTRAVIGMGQQRVPPPPGQKRQDDIHPLLRGAGNHGAVGQKGLAHQIKTDAL